MADTPDLDTLAKTYLDLWQRQLSGMTENPEALKQLTQAAQQGLELTQEIGKAWGETFLQAMQEQELAKSSRTAQHEPSGSAAKESDEDERSEQQDGGAPGPKTPVSAPGGDEQRIHDLERRIALLEERLAALDAGTGKRRRSSHKKT